MIKELAKVANALMQTPTFAGDESGWKGRCDKVNLEWNEPGYREFFVRAVAKSAHGSVILHKCTVSMQVDGKSFPQFLSESGKLAGMKVDAGTYSFGKDVLVGSVAELDKRCAEAKANGCVFTKYRYPFEVGTASGHLGHGAEQLSAYCAKSLEHGLVPYAEPELVRDGSHSIDECEVQMKRFFELFMASFYRWGLRGEEIIIKTNVIEPGSKVADSATASEVAERSVAFFKPIFRAFAGVKLLSGGQPAEMAFQRTSAAVALLRKLDTSMGNQPLLSTSFSRAAMDGVLETYRDSGSEPAGDLFAKISERNLAACRGE